MAEWTEKLILDMARAWKEGGGDAMGFNWCWPRILAEILKLEHPEEKAREPERA